MMFLESCPGILYRNILQIAFFKIEISKKIPLEAGATSVKNLLNLSLAVINCEYDYNDNTIIVRKRKEKSERLIRRRFDGSK